MKTVASLVVPGTASPQDCTGSWPRGGRINILIMIMLRKHVIGTHRNANMWHSIRFQVKHVADISCVQELSSLTISLDQCLSLCVPWYRWTPWRHYPPDVKLRNVTFSCPRNLQNLVLVLLRAEQKFLQFKQINQLDATISQGYYLTFMYS